MKITSAMFQAWTRHLGPEDLALAEDLANEINFEHDISAIADEAELRAYFNRVLADNDVPRQRTQQEPEDE